MFRQFEIILTAVCLGLSAIFLILILIRMRAVLLHKGARVPIWNKEVGILFKACKSTLAISLPLMAFGVIYFIFVISMPSAVIRVYAKTTFVIVFFTWALLEFFLCHSISLKLLHGSILRRVFFCIAITVCLIGAIYLFPFIPVSAPYPAEGECVILDLPVRGIWLAGQAGASDLTNGHTINRYAIDILKLGPDGRLYRGEEKHVTDYYSYNEPVYAPADGKITQIVDSLQSDLIGNMDRDHPGGNFLIMNVDNGKYVYFGHLKRKSIVVAVGQVVKVGTLLGYCGNSGYSTHPHLHMHVQNKPMSDADGRITYPFRFFKMDRNRFLFWQTVRNAAFQRNDRFRD